MFPVSRQVLRQLPQISGAAENALPVGVQGSQLRLARGHILRQTPGLRQQLALAGQHALRALPQGCGLCFSLRYGLFCPGGTLRVRPQAFVNGCQLTGKALNALPQSG